MKQLALEHAVLAARAGAEPHPGLLLLHGRGTDERDLLPLGAELDPRLFTVSARGPLAFPYGGYAWYSLGTEAAGFPDAGSLSHTLDLLDRFLTEIVATYPIDPDRLFVGGFSMGGAIAAALALLHPDRIAGAVVLSSYLPLHADLPYRQSEMAGRSIFLAHGESDPVIPVKFGRQSRDFLRETPVNLTYREYPMGHQTSLPELQDVQSWFSELLRDGASETR